MAALLQESLGALGGEDSPLRARLLARLALELYYAGDPERRLALSEEAVALARRLGDPRTLAACLDARHYALWRPETVQERLEVASELRRIAAQVGDPELELEGAGWTVVDLLELGDVDGADIQIAAASRLAAALHRPLYEWWTSLFHCARAQLEGRFDDAERLAHETLAVGQRGQAENAVHVFAQSMFNIRREQGRLAEVEDAVRGFIAMYPAVPAWRCSLALLELELGREDAGAGGAGPRSPRRASARSRATRSGSSPSHCCPRSAPASARGATRGSSTRCSSPTRGATWSWGVRRRATGRRRASSGCSPPCAGEWALAERHLADALAMHVAMRARPLVARTQLAWGEMELARGDVAGRERLAEATCSATRSGWPR